MKGPSSYFSVRGGDFRGLGRIENIFEQRLHLKKEPHMLVHCSCNHQGAWHQLEAGSLWKEGIGQGRNEAARGRGRKGREMRRHPKQGGKEQELGI